MPTLSVSVPAACALRLEASVPNAVADAATVEALRNSRRVIGGKGFTIDFMALRANALELFLIASDLEFGKGSA